MSPIKKQHNISILWGREHEPGDKPLTYSFDTEAELDAFLAGVGEAVGWMAYQEVEEDYVVSGGDEIEDAVAPEEEDDEQRDL